MSITATATPNSGFFTSNNGTSTVLWSGSDNGDNGSYSSVSNGTIGSANPLGQNNIITSSNTNVGQLIGGGDYFIFPGTTGSSIGIVAGLGATTFHVAGSVQLTTSIGALSAVTIDVDGGNVALGASIASAISGLTVNIGNGGTFTPGTSVLGLLTSTTINFNGAGTFVANAGGTVLNLIGSITINGYNPSSGRIIAFQNLDTTVSRYVIGSVTNGTQTVTLEDSNGNSVASFAVTETSGFRSGSYQTNSAGPLTLSVGSNGFLDVAATPYSGAPCFLAGSMIRTPAGERAVEDLEYGDEVTISRNGEVTSRQVVWVGRQRMIVQAARSLDEAGYPVRILKDAIADGVPFKDMLITAEHCLFFDGHFVPARMLVNGRSIFYDKSITSYDYYHIETEQHSVITADGMLTESYLDTGNRRAFHQAGNVSTLGDGRTRSWDDDAAAPLTVSRSVVEPLFRQIVARADGAALPAPSEQPVLTDDANLHLETDTGMIIRPVREANGRVMFMIPTGIDSVRLVSNASRPSDAIGPFVDDRRSLGVLVGAISLFDADATHTVTTHLTGDALAGWHDQDTTTMRWTNGNAALPLPARAPGVSGVLSIEIKAAGPYLVDNITPVSMSEPLRLVG